jgi:hypothetical protein
VLDCGCNDCILSLRLDLPIVSSTVVVGHVLRTSCNNEERKKKRENTHLNEFRYLIFLEFEVTGEIAECGTGFESGRTGAVGVVPLQLNY